MSSRVAAVVQARHRVVVVLVVFVLAQVWQSRRVATTQLPLEAAAQAEHIRPAHQTMAPPGQILFFQQLLVPAAGTADLTQMLAVMAVLAVAEGLVLAPAAQEIRLQFPHRKAIMAGRVLQIHIRVAAAAALAALEDRHQHLQVQGAEQAVRLPRPPFLAQVFIMLAVAAVEAVQTPAD